MYKDQMTPVERARALAAGQEVDRQPVGIIYGAAAHSLLGWTINQEWESGRNLAEVQKKVYQTLAPDSLSAAHGLHGLALLYGAEAEYPPHAPLTLIRYPLTDVNGYRQLTLEQTEHDERAAKCLDCLEILRDELGDTVGCGMSFAGAFTAASGLVGPETLLCSLIEDQEGVHGLLSFANQALLRLAEPFLRQEFNICLADPMASGTIISPAWFREFVLPYTQEFIKQCDRIWPGAISAHICGDTTFLLEDIAGCGYSSFSLDNVVDLAVAKERIGKSIHLIGNVPPVEIMYMGDPQQVQASVRDCFRKAWDSPRGFTISTGCDCPYGTPLDNLLAYMDEAKKCASVPYVPENFS